MKRKKVLRIPGRDGPRREGIRGRISQQGHAARTATSEEEYWLTKEEEAEIRLQVVASQVSCERNAIADELLIFGIDGGQVYDDSDPPAGAETFDYEKELDEWENAQKEARCREDAEQQFREEERREQELLELTEAESIQRHTAMRSLQEGYARFRGRTWQSALAVAADLRDQLKNEQEIAALEDDRHAAEIEALQRREQNALFLLEVEKERGVCSICFEQPRDVLVLPCMHFHYCNSCIVTSLEARNVCPTCRSPVSGVLKCNLSMQ
eukprot:jgi/Mesen1/7703/ME000405S06992